HAVCGAPGSQLKNPSSFQSEGWAFTRNLSLPGICKRRNLRAQSARRGKSSLCSDRQPRPFFQPLVCEHLGDQRLRRTKNTARPAGVNGTEVVQSGTFVPYSRDPRLPIGKQRSEVRDQTQRLPQT